MTTTNAPKAVTHLACVEVGGSGVQTVIFAGEAVSFVVGATLPPGATLAIAVPGYIDGGRVVNASNLGWIDVDPAIALGLSAVPAIVCNDAEAAALGEWALRAPLAKPLLYVGMGTGVGGAVVVDGAVIAANLLGHGGGFGNRACVCGRHGCLETVAAGWALPDPVPMGNLPDIACAVARSIELEPLASGATVVVAGGLIDRYPVIVEHIAAQLPIFDVQPSDRPPGAKSAAAWGLRHALNSRPPAARS